MIRKYFLELIVAVMIVFFLHSAVLSIIRVQSLENLLSFYTYQRKTFAWIIIIYEASAGLLLVFHRTRLIGLLLSVLFMAALGTTLWLTRGFPHDFEGILNDISEPQRWGLAITLFVLGLIAIVITVSNGKSTRRKVPSDIAYT